MLKTTYTGQGWHFRQTSYHIIRQGICSSRLAIALKAAGQCLTRKGERYLYGCKQSEINI